ncbi:MAG: hypothetical protein RLW87_15945 [Alphaproteobacteria bacterium]|jgi:hypothetical protein|uniref:hypothetical protein n=1 Tax=Pacificispira sp. TaxID=2888761 RepID=UPI001B07D177|nr:hypothetical protein [Alphaproteobacteria bacterium]MBO6861777.1 hypothetical protein [Alphaproteobacteria bacterium]
MTEFFAPLTSWLNGITGLDISIHGYIAILLTLIGVFALYLGLLYLLRLSHRSGHDEIVYDYRDPRQDVK